MGEENNINFIVLQKEESPSLKKIYIFYFASNIFIASTMTTPGIIFVPKYNFYSFDRIKYKPKSKDGSRDILSNFISSQVSHKNILTCWNSISHIIHFIKFRQNVMLSLISMIKIISI